MKFLVTGAPGFLGSHVIQYLTKRGHEVIATARSIEKAKSSNWYHSVLFKPYDFSNISSDISVHQYFNNPDILIHLAWDGLPNFKSLLHVEQYLQHQYLFLKNYISSGGEHILVTGTCLEYGLQSGCLAEDMPANPVTAYGVAKNSLRQFIDILQKNQPSFIFQWYDCSICLGMDNKLNQSFHNYNRQSQKGINILICLLAIKLVIICLFLK
jgi:dTDP-6-deoxy-L-talose 4-dehydrogenase (NAD+)